LGGGFLTLVSNVDAQGLNKDNFTPPAYGIFLGACSDYSLFFLD